MTSRHLRAGHGRIAFALLTLALFADSGHAARPRIYAITGATVVTNPGRKLESATVVVRDGLIEAAGTGVKIPADAIAIDGKGLYVYPV
jgi:imidazolonepropionase-like amidohydrolase